MPDFFLLLSAATFTGVIGALIGHIKARVLAGFMWGFFLGPIGWAIVVLGPNAKYIDCPHCGGKLPMRQATCAHCKSPVTWSRDGRKAFRPSSPAR
jgi:hypothetical protein